MITQHNTIDRPDCNTSWSWLTFLILDSTWWSWFKECSLCIMDMAVVMKASLKLLKSEFLFLVALSQLHEGSCFLGIQVSIISKKLFCQVYHSWLALDTLESIECLLVGCMLSQGMAGIKRKSSLLFCMEAESSSSAVKSCYERPFWWLKIMGEKKFPLFS